MNTPSFSYTVYTEDILCRNMVYGAHFVVLIFVFVNNFLGSKGESLCIVFKDINDFKEPGF